MTERRSYEGGCHCGKVRYKVTTDLAQVIQCNCSICSKKGHLLTFVSPEQFALAPETMASSLTDYQFNNHIVHHLFCSTCGIGSYGHGTGPGGKKMYAINVRCLEGVDPATLQVTPFDGKSL